MPWTSWFTPPGMLELSSIEPAGLRIFESMRAAYGKAFAQDGLHDSELFAQTAVLAMLLANSESVEAQLDPLQATWGLTALEHAYQVFPEPFANIVQRQNELALWMELPRHGTRIDVETWLRERLGDDFIGIWAPGHSDVTSFPSAFLDSPMMIRQSSAPRKNVVILDPVLAVGEAYTVRYVPTNPNFLTIATSNNEIVSELELFPGDEFVIDSRDITRAERVTIQSTGIYSFGGKSWRTLTATFGHVHNPRVAATLYDFPYWTTNAQTLAVVVKPSIARDARKTRMINRFLLTNLRVTTTWAIVEEISPGVAGPFKVEEGKISVTPIGELVL